MASISKSVIQDIDGTFKTVTDFIAKDSSMTRRAAITVPADAVNRPDILATMIYGNPSAYPLLIFAVNKCLFNLEQGETVEVFV